MPPDLNARLERALNPRTVAVVGDKGPGFMWLRGYREFTGKLYSVQVDPTQIAGIEALGVPNFTSLLDIPDEIDYVQVAVPRRFAPLIAADAARKKVGAVAFFTSGFAETDEEEGIRLQEELTRIARENDLLIIGPNCMGLYNPAVKVRQSGQQQVEAPGPVGFISMSGTHAINFGVTGAANGVRISKSVSIGNQIVLNAAHYLEYLAQDADTRVIGMYLEGVKDGRALFAALKKASAAKPVIVWKGGQTPEGQRATHSHTASLGTPARIWDAIVRQCGLIATNSLDETIDACKALVYSKPATGRRMALLAMTGGQSVVITDAFAKAGLEVPTLTEGSYARLREFFNIIGGSYRNPFDMAGTIGQRGAVSEHDNLRAILEIVDADPNIDAIAVETRGPGGGGPPEQQMRMVNALKELQERSSKPIVTIVHPGADEGNAAQGRQLFLENGLASFHSFERAAKALASAIGYWRWRAGLD
ncbi:MAG TPA: CoA-binding protein [Dehalococcoidia bacterium]|nr:CoA-binding protein [Dehalococcoidia bacterium]